MNVKIINLEDIEIHTRLDLALELSQEVLQNIELEELPLQSTIQKILRCTSHK